MKEEVINVAQVEQVSTVERVKVKLKSGDIEVEIESPIDKITDVVEKVVAGLSRATPRSVEGEQRRPRGPATCRGLVEELWREDWFSKPRSLSDVVDELARRGYNYNSTAVSHSLTDLVRSGVLTRMGTPRTYRYVQKKPPS